MNAFFFSNNECLIDINLIAPLAKSDDACIEIEIKMKLHFEYVKRKQNNWSELLEELVSEKR